jgi:manganese transport protein
VASQVVLSFTLPFAMVPLIWFTASRQTMGELIAPRHTSALAAIIAALIIALNTKLIFDALAG